MERVDVDELRDKVKVMYRAVADAPHGTFHFDIVTEHQLTEAIVCDVNLWASCIGGAMQEDDCRRAIEDAGLELHTVQASPQYNFISDSARGATETFGVKSISVLAMKPSAKT